MAKGSFSEPVPAGANGYEPSAVVGAPPEERKSKRGFPRSAENRFSSLKPNEYPSELKVGNY